MLAVASHRLPVIAALALLGLAPAADAAPRKCTLDELIALGRARSPTVAIAQAQINVSEAQKAEVLRMWAPVGEIRYLLTGAPAIECREPDGGADPVRRTQNCAYTVDPTNGKSVSFITMNIAGVGMQADVNFAQPIYTFGKIESATRAAGHGIDAGRAGLEATRREVEMNMTRAYWGLKTARAARDTLVEALGELSPWEKKIEEDIDSEAPKFSLTDLQRLRVALSQVELVRANLERSEAHALAAIRTLAGEEVEVDDAEIVALEPTLRTVDDLMSASAASRPEILQVRSGVEAYRALARLKLTEMLPDLALLGNFTYRYAPSIEDAQNAFMSKANAYGFGLYLMLRQPLDLVVKASRWEKAKAELAVLESQRRGMEASVRLDVQRAYADLLEARRRVVHTEKGQRIARGWLTAVRQNLDLGTAEPRDLVDAARSYFDLRLGYYQAIMDVNVAIGALRRAAGVDVGQ